jgi:hypothetical protein
MDDATENLITGLLPAVEEQLTSPATPYVAKTLARLLALGEDPPEARRLIAFCLADEANRMMIDRRPFDPKRYQALLAALPELPA